MIRFKSLLTGARVVLLLGGLVSCAAYAAPRPVVLELFTSNSCSSCPPAYALLRDLQAQPPVDDVQLIVLSQHVDYWNQLSWVDRFSDARFTERQRGYARQVFGSSRVYTPQLVVNGRREMVGSRRGEVRAAIAEAAGELDLDVTLNARRTGSDRLAVTAGVAGADLDAPATVWLALTQDDVVSRIGAGENRGRRLLENGVVRVWEKAGTRPAATRDAQRYAKTLTLPSDAEADNLSVVAFVQRDSDRAIIGAARIGLSDPHPARPSA